MKIGKVRRKVVKPDCIPVKLPSPKPIPAPDVFKKKPVTVPK